MNFISLKAQRDVSIASRAKRACECAIKPRRVLRAGDVNKGRRYFHLHGAVCCMRVI